MKNSILTFILSQFLATTLAHGATVNVGAGQSIQTAIDNASAGDVLNLTAPVSYNGDLNITKSLRIVSLLSANQSVSGNLHIEGITAGQSVTLKNLSIAGTVDIKDSSVNVLRCTLSSTLTAVNPGGGNTLLTFVQSNIIGKLTSKTTRSWIGYSNLRQSYFEGIVEIVGNDFDGNGLGGIGIDLTGTQTVANIHNNLIHDFRHNGRGNYTRDCIGISVDGNAKAEIRNNEIYSNKDHEYRGTNSFVGIGIYVSNTALTTVSSNIIFDNADQSTTLGSCQIYAPKENVVVRNNGMTGTLVKGGVEHYNTISDVSRASGFLSNTVARMNDKAGQNKGSPDDYHKDHDGSRNDIGANGGRNYIPDGRTTDKPIPIFFSLAPQAVPIGGTVTIESTGATVK
jgi:hypothetical protein